MSSLTEKGPKYGYYPEPSKIYLVVHPNFVEKAHQLFDRFGIRIVEGSRYMGGFIGSDEGKIRFTLKKVQEWLDCLGELSKVAEKEPQAALVGLTRSLQCEWNFVQRVVKDTSQLFAPLEKMLKENFLPSLLETSSVTYSDRVLYSLPVKRGGLGVRNPIESAELAFSTSREATDCLVSSILLQDDFDQTLHKTKMREARKNHEEKQNAVDKDKLDELLAVLPADQKRAIRRIIDNNCFLWLTSLPFRWKIILICQPQSSETLSVSGTENHSNVLSRDAMDVNKILTYSMHILARRADW